MPPVSTDFGEGNGEICAFQRRFEALIGQIPAECAPIEAAKKMEKLRFVHAVMVMANSDGERGERIKKRQKAPLLNQWTENNERTKGQRNATQTEEPSWGDPIGEAVKVLRETTKMLEQMLDDWRGEERRRGDATLWHRKTDKAMAPPAPNGTVEGRTEAAEAVDTDQTAWKPTTENTRHQQPHSLLSSKISFPSELRRYRMTEERHEE
ncbi:hypothetical protein niasHT_013481 [Heterodera trifolii]|uniref:Uncharacterized protein n=1 Tax=Heterodera trifolii TaxID=157864 RepID=A0ABD2LCT2_9BILA